MALAKLTSKNQLTLPKDIVAQFPGAQYFSIQAEYGRIILEPPGAQYFSIQAEYGRIILEPVNPQPLRAVHEKMEQLNITETDIEKAVAWSRKKK